MNTFGEWLRRQRDLRRLTRDEFAKRIGCSVSALRKFEDGERRPSAQIAELMAHALDVPLVDRPTFVRVARGELNLDRLSPTWNQAAATTSPRTRLPTPATPLIGRQHEVEQVARLLRDPQCRLLTLAGPGGIGKTRIAVEAASQLQDAFVDGVYFIPLTSVETTRLLAPVIADAIGFAFQDVDRADPKTQLFNYLKGKQALLLADNLEQLLPEPDIGMLAELLANAAQVKLLVTSRESSGLQGEWVLEVQGLPIPEERDAERDAANTAVELFLQRARRAHVGFQATPADYPAIVRTCRLVDGMPLGIELAAAWARTLTCDEIAHEIERGLDFLSASMREFPARHRSLRAVFSHSWRLLSQEEQQVLRRLSVFQGGFRREAAEGVAEATLSDLSGLVTKSLLRRNGSGRYDLHDLVRRFAKEQLASLPEEEAATRARHGRYYMTAFGQADGRLRSPAQRETLAELTADIDNFRDAWNWAVAHGEFASVEETLRTFAMFYDTRGWYQEGIDALDRAVEALESSHGPSPTGRPDQIALGHLLTTRGLLTYRLARHEQARAILERSLDILRPLNEPAVVVEPVTFLGTVMSLTGDYATAMELFGEGLEKARSVGDHWFAAMCLSLQGNVSRLIGLSGNEHERLQSAVAEWRAIGDPRFTAFGLNFLGQSALALGRYQEARAALEESVALNLSVGARWNLGHAYQGLGAVAQAQGDHPQAVNMYRQCVDTFAELGGRYYAAQGLADMGRSFFALGNDAEAGRVWRESLRIATETQATPVALEALVGLAGLRAKEGHREHALELLWILLIHPSTLQDTKARTIHLQSELEAQLTRREIETIQARATAKTFDSAVEEMLTLAGAS